MPYSYLLVVYHTLFHDHIRYGVLQSMADQEATVTICSNTFWKVLDLSLSREQSELLFPRKSLFRGEMHGHNLRDSGALTRCRVVKVNSALLTYKEFYDADRGRYKL